MDPVLLIGRYPYSHWVLGARPGGIGSYRPLSQLGVLPCDRGNVGGSPWLLRFVTISPLYVLVAPATILDSSVVWLGGVRRGRRAPSLVHVSSRWRRAKSFPSRGILSILRGIGCRGD